MAPNKEGAKKFLQRVANDPAYRKKLESDPVGTLGELGVKVDPKHVPAGGVKLPVSKEILDHLDEWTEALDDVFHSQIWRGR